MVWKASKSGEFSMKSFYSTLELENEVLAPSKLVWGSWAPSKVGFFFHGKQLREGFSPWEAAWARILTIDQLRRRGCF